MSLRARLLSFEAAELTTAKEYCERFLAHAKLEGNEQHDKPDTAEARENADLAAAFDPPVEHYRSEIDVWRSSSLPARTG